MGGQQLIEDNVANTRQSRPNLFALISSYVVEGSVWALIRVCHIPSASLATYDRIFLPIYLNNNKSLWVLKSFCQLRVLPTQKGTIDSCVASSEDAQLTVVERATKKFNK